MKHRSLTLLITLIPCISYASLHRELMITYQHIENLDTKIIFCDEAKSIYNLIQQGRNGYFGKTKVINKISEKPFFKKTGTIKKMNPDDLHKIAMGYSFYCYNIKPMNNTTTTHYYGAIICCNKPNNNEFSFDDKYFRNAITLFKEWFLQRLYEKDKQKTLTDNKNADVNPTIGNLINKLLD